MMYHAYNEYNKWKKEPYQATVEEWESWAERIIQAFETEMNAGKKDFELIGRLQVENDVLKQERDALAEQLQQKREEIAAWEAKAQLFVDQGDELERLRGLSIALYEQIESSPDVCNLDEFDTWANAVGI